MSPLSLQVQLHVSTTLNGQFINISTGFFVSPYTEFTAKYWIEELLTFTGNYYLSWAEQTSVQAILFHLSLSSQLHTGSKSQLPMQVIITFNNVQNVHFVPIPAILFNLSLTSQLHTGPKSRLPIQVIITFNMQNIQVHFIPLPAILFHRLVGSQLHTGLKS